MLIDDDNGNKLFTTFVFIPFDKCHLLKCNTEYKIVNQINITTQVQVYN